MCSSIDSSTKARSIENYNLQFSSFEFQPKLMNLFRVSFLTTLDIYIYIYIYIRLILKTVTHGYRDQEIYFLCEKLLRLYAIGYCNQVLPNLH